MPNEKRKGLYDFVSQYIDIGSYDDFDSRMNNADERKRFYDGISQDLDIGDYNEFEKNIFDSKYKLKINGREQNVSEKEYKDFMARRSRVRGNASATQPKTAATTPAGTAPSMAPTGLPEGFGQLSPEAGLPQHMQEEARERREESYTGGTLGGAIQAAQTRNTINALNGDTEAQKTAGLDRMSQQMKDRADYAEATGKELKDPVLDMTQFGVAPTVERDENGEIVTNENGEPIVGMVNDEVRANTQTRISHRIEEDKLEEQNEAMKREQVGELAGIIDGMIAKIKSQNVRTTPFQITNANGQRIDHLGVTEEDRHAQYELSRLYSAQRSLRDAQRIIAEADHNQQSGTFGKWLESSFAGGAARGFGQKFFDVNTWVMGATDLADATNVKLALEKADKGMALSEAEQAMLDAKAVEMATNAYFGSYVGHGYKAGQVTAESIPFMLEMCINPASATGETVGAMMTRYAIKRFGSKAARRAVAIGSRIAGDIAGSAVMAGTTGLMRTTADAIERESGDIRFEDDENGRTMYVDHTEGESPVKAFAKAYAGTTIENFSEMVGEYFAPVFGMVGKLLGKFTPQSVKNFAQNVAASDIARVVSDFEKHAKWNGVFSEYAEEVAGNIMNALVVGDMTLDTAEDTGVFNLEQNIETFLGVSLMGGVMSSVKTLGYRTPKYRARKEMQNSDRVGATVFNDADAWDDIKVRILHGSDEQVSQTIADVLNGDYTDEQKTAVLQYAKNVEAYNGMLMGEQSRRAENAGSVEVDLETSFDNGYTLDDAQVMNDAKNAYDYHQNQLQEQFLDESTAVQTQLDRDPIGTLSRMTDIYTEEQKKAALDYLNAKATYEGMVNRVRDDIDAQVAESDRKIDMRTKNGTNTLQPATMVINDRQVYIVDGDVTMSKDGGTIDKENSSESFLIRDAETGELEWCGPNDILSVGEAIDADQLKEQTAQELREAYAQQEADKIDGTLPFNQGDVYSILDEQGQSHQVTILADNGDGTVMAAFDGQASNDPVAKETIQQMSDNENMARLQEQLAQKVVDEAGTMGNAEGTGANEYKLGDVVTLHMEDGQVVRGEISAEADPDGMIEVMLERRVNGMQVPRYTKEQLDKLTAIPTAPAAEPQGTVAGTSGNAEGTEASESAGAPLAEPMPKVGEGENAEPDFLAVTPARAYAYLYNESGLDAANADAFLNNNISAAQKTVTNIEKKKPKMGTSIAEFNKKNTLWQKQMDEAQALLDKWKAIKAERDAVVEKANAKESEQQKLNTEIEGEIEYLSSGQHLDDCIADVMGDAITTEFEAQTLEDAVNISLVGVMRDKGYGITPESLAQEGIDKAQQKRLVGIATKAENGGKSLQQIAHEIYENLDESIKSQIDREQDVRNAIIEIINNGNPRSYVVDKIRQTSAAAYSQAENYVDSMYYADYGMSYNEWVEQEIAAIDAIREKYMDVDLEYLDELINELRENDEQRQSEGNGRSNQVLSGTQTVVANRSGESTDQGAENGTGSEGNRQDGGVSGTSGRESADGSRGREAEGYSGERQGNLGETKEIRLSDEIDENGLQFVLAPNGELAFGYIDKSTGLTPAPILLSEGIITNTETNAGYGLVHIEARHGEQIRKAGYKSVIEFIEEVAKNWEVIKEGNERNGKTTYLLQLTDKHDNTLIVELSGDGTYWNINTAGIFKTSYGAKKKEVYNRHTTDNQSAEIDERSLDKEQGGTPTSTSMLSPTPKVHSVPAVGSSASTDATGVNHGTDNGAAVASGNSPLTSEGKGSNNSAAVQENQQKSADNQPKSATILNLGDGRYAVSDVENFVQGHVQRIIDEGGFDAEIVGVKVIGSYMRGEQTPDSDLDVLVEYKGKAKEDALFDALAEEGLEINGVNVDINPITEGKSGTIEQFMKRNAGFSKIAQAEAIMQVLGETAGINVVMETQEAGQRAAEEQNEGVEMMAGRVNSRRKQIASDVDLSSLTDIQKSIVEAYTNESSDIVVSFSDATGKRRSIRMEQGSEQKRGVKHSLFRHYGMSRNNLTSQDILLAEEVLKTGVRSVDGNKVDYVKVINGVKYTIATQTKGRDGQESFVNYYTDRFEPSSQQGTQNTNNTLAQATMAQNSGANVENNSDNAKSSERNLPKSAEFMTVWHGSAAVFEHFDSDYFLSGEGSMAYGDGHYVSEVRGTGERYAEIASESKATKTEAELDILDAAENYPSNSNLTFRDKWNESREDLIKTAKEDYLLAKRYAETPEDYADEERRYNELLSSRRYEQFPSKQLYRVEIPDDNGSNYILWSDMFNKSKAQEIADKMDAEGMTVTLTDGREVKAGEYLMEHLSGRGLFNELEALTGGSRKVSKLLSHLGYVGIKVQTGYGRGGDGRGFNYVVFKDSDLEIKERIEFMHTPKGTVYGWAEGNSIHLTPEGVNPNSPIHEYTHLWAKAVQKKAPKLWENIKSLLKDTPIWDEVVNDPAYQGLTSEDEIASEALSRMSGRDNAKKMVDMAQKMIDEADGVFAKAEARSLIERMKKALSEFWKWVGKNLFDIKDFKSVEEITDRVLFDMLNKTELGLSANEGGAEFSKESKASEGASAPDAGVRTRMAEEFKDGEVLPIEYEWGNDNIKVRGLGGFYRNSDQLLDAFRNKYPQYIANFTEDGEGIEVYRWRPKASESAGAPLALERKTRRALEMVQEMAQKLGLDIEVKTDTEGLTGRRAKKKGWYDINTGKIVIVLPNHSNSADVMRTILHEGVAHHGLRKLFRGDFDTFLDNVFNNVPADVRRKIVDMAARRNWDFRTATEEYLAGLAEDTAFDDAINRSWWGRIKAFFFDMLRKKGFSGVLTDNELRYILWRSYRNLERKGRGDLFDMAEDVVMQNRLGVGNYSQPKTAESGKAAEDNAGAVNERFNEDIDNFESLPQGYRFELGLPSDKLLAAGFESLPIMMRASLVGKKKGDPAHSFEADDLKNLVLAMQNPIAVFNYTKDNMRNVIVDITKGDKHFLVGITLNYKGKNSEFEINSVSGLFPKDSHEWIKWIQDGKAVAIYEKQKVQDLIDSLRINPAEANRIGLNLDAVAKLVNNFENPNISEGKVSDSESGLMFRDGDAMDERDKAIVRDHYERQVRNGMYQFREAMQDSMLSLRRLMEEVEKATGKKIEDYENAYMTENALSSANHSQQELYGSLLFRPLLDEIHRISKEKSSRDEVTRYMMAKHGLERNEVMARREAERTIRDKYEDDLRKAQKAVDDDPLDWDAVDALDELKQKIKDETDAQYDKNRDRDYAGLTGLMDTDDTAEAEALAQEFVDKFEKEHDTNNLWTLTNACTKATLEKMYKSGLMNRALFAEIGSMYKHYIPLRGFDVTTSDEVYTYLTSEHSGFSSPLKRAKGRTSVADDPIATIASMADSAIVQGNRNLMKQKFLKFAMNHPSDALSVNRMWLRYNDVTGIWEAVTAKLDEKDSADEILRKTEAFEAQMEALAEAQPGKYMRGSDAVNMPYKVISENLSEHQVHVKMGGKDYIITVNGSPRVAQAVNGLTNPDNENTGAVGAVLRAGEWVNRQMSAFYTTRNPEFVLSNFLRDALYANSTMWVRESPSYAVRFNKNFAKLNPKVIYSLLRKHKQGKLDMNNPMEEAFYQFMVNGGETGYTVVHDIDKQKKLIKKYVRMKDGTIPGELAWNFLGEKLDEINRAVENCARFAAFYTSRQEGRSIDRSVFDAKEVSVNFNKKGAGSTFMGKTDQTVLGNVGAFTSGLGRSFYVFWNAAIQGTTNFARLHKHHTAKALAMDASLMLLGAIISGLGGDDDDEYANLPPYVRRSHICFKIPFTDLFCCIPLGIEQRAIYGLGELFSSVASGRERLSGIEIAKEIAGSLSSLLPLDLMESNGDISWATFAPSFVKPFVEVAVNKNWKGLPIYKETPFNKNDPEWTKADKNTSQLLVDFSRWCNEIAGGDDVIKAQHFESIMNWNPSKVEHILEGAFGGVSTTISKMVKFGMMVTGKQEFDIRNIPLASRIIKSADEGAGSRRVNSEYWKYYNEYQDTKRRVEHYEDLEDDGDESAKEKLDKIYASPEYKRYLVVDEYSVDVKQLSDELSDAIDSYERDSLQQELDSTKAYMLKRIREEAQQ